MDFKVTEAPIIKSDVVIGAQIVEMLLNDELEHSGRKGQKWGQRLYQNKDGSLTPLGRARYRKMTKARAAEKANAELKSGKASFDKNGNPRTKGKAKSTSDAEEATKKTKSPEEMTEAELRSEITKLQLRKQLDTLYNEMNPPKESQFKKTAGKFLNEAVVPAATEAGKNLIKNALEEKVGKALGLSKYEVKEAKKELGDEFKEATEQMNKANNYISALKNYQANNEWAKKEIERMKAEKDSSKTGSKKNKDKEERTEQAEDDNVFSKAAKKAKEKGDAYAEKGQKAKEKGENFKKAAEAAANAATNEVKKSKKKKKSKADVYDKDGKKIGTTTFEHSLINESDVALGKALIHGELSDDELQHYGVIGMKWGVHRARKALSKATTKESLDKALDRLEKHRQKSADKLVKLNKQADKLKAQRKKDVEVNQAKAANLAARAARMRKKAHSILNTEVSRYTRTRRADKLDLQAARLNARIESTKAQIVKNAKNRKLFEQNIKDIDQTLIDYGRSIVEGARVQKLKKSIDSSESWAKRIDKGFSDSEKRVILNEEKHYAKEYKNKARNSKDAKEHTENITQHELHDRRYRELQRIMKQNNKS